MAYRRVALRCINKSDLSGSDQEDFADDVQSRVENASGELGGYFTCCGGQNWIEIEGDESGVDSVIQKHKDDDRVEATMVLEDSNPSQVLTDKWRAHTEPDLYCDVT